MHHSSKWSSWCLPKSNIALLLKMSPFQNKLCVLKQKMKSFLKSIRNNLTFKKKYFTGKFLRLMWDQWRNASGSQQERWGDGSIISKFPGIARDIDYLIHHYFQKLQKNKSSERNANRAFWGTLNAIFRRLNGCFRTEKITVYNEHCCHIK